MSPATITVFEGGRVVLPKGADGDRAKVRLLGTTVGGRVAFSTRRGDVYAGQFAGAVDLGRVKVEVLPKPFGIDDVVSARSLLFDLLHWAGADARVGWLPGGASPDGADVLDAVQRHAVSELLQRLELGPPRRYQPLEEVSSVIRGRIVFSSYARQLPSDAHLVPVRFAPLTLDNDLGRLLKALANFLWHRSTSFAIRRDLDRCLDILQAVATVDLTLSLVERVRLGRTEVEWKRLVEYASLVASGRNPDPTQTGASNQPTLLFPLNGLFESVVRRVLSKALPTPWACASSTGAFKLLTTTDDADALSIKPDLIFRKGKGTSAVGDAKWKVLAPTGPRHGISPADIYQLLTYMRRVGVSQGLLFYPRAGWMPPNWSVQFKVAGSTSERVAAFGVDVPALVQRNLAQRSEAQGAFATRVQAALAVAASGST